MIIPRHIWLGFKYHVFSLFFSLWVYFSENVKERNRKGVKSNATYTKHRPGKTYRPMQLQIHIQTRIHRHARTQTHKHLKTRTRKHTSTDTTLHYSKHKTHTYPTPTHTHTHMRVSLYLIKRLCSARTSNVKSIRVQRPVRMAVHLVSQYITKSTRVRTQPRWCHG